MRMRLLDCFTADLRYSRQKRPGFLLIFRNLLLSPGFRAVVYYRLADFLRHLGPLTFITWHIGTLILMRLSRVPGVEINTKYPIGEGFVISHPHDIVIGIGARIGKGVTMYNGVTLGMRKLNAHDTGENGDVSYPTIESGVTIYAGAKVLGPVTIGQNSVIGANAVVLESFPASSVIVGVPAKNVAKRLPQKHASATDKSAEDSERGAMKESA